MATILLAEDDAPSRSAWRNTLVQEGFRVLEAADGQDALRIARDWKGPLRLLITDILMPYLDGVKLADRLQEERPTLRVLYVAGRAESRLLANRIRSEQILLKPFRPEALLRTVNEALAPPALRASG